MEFLTNTIHRKSNLNFEKACEINKRLSSGETFKVKSFGDDIDLSLGYSVFYSYEQIYGESSYMMECRETLTSMLKKQIRRDFGAHESISFITCIINKYEALAKYKNSTIEKVVKRFLSSCKSYDADISKFLTGVECFDYKGENSNSRKTIIFPITNNDRGKAFTTASALIGLLRFPEYLINKNGSAKTLNTTVDLLKEFYMKEAFGFEAHADDDDQESYYGWPHYNANYILWLKLAQLGIFTTFEPHKYRIVGPISYIRSLTKKELITTKLRQNYSEAIEKVFAMGNKFLTCVSPNFVEFITERKKALKL